MTIWMRNQFQPCNANSQNFEFKTNKNGEPYFILKAKNHQEIGRSEYYSSQASAKNGVASVVKNATTTVIKDKTQA